MSRYYNNPGFCTACGKQLKKVVMDKIMRKNIIAGLLILIAAGCGETIYSGRITEKKFIQEHWETRLTYEYNPISEQFESETEEVFVEDQYLIEICNYTAEGRQFMTKRIEVSPAQFSVLKVGEWYMPVVEGQ